MSRRFVKPSFDTLPTRFLYVAGIYNDMGTDDSTLISVFSRFGPLEDPYVEMIEGKRFCFVIFCNVSDAIKARDELRDQPIENLSGTNKVIIKYAKEYEFHPVPESEPSIKHNEVSIPGLVFIEDFLTEDEEQVLLEGLCIESNPTWMLALNRRVQHYGFSFNYRTLLLDYTAETPPFPSDVTCNGFLEKLQCVSGGVSSSFGDSDHPINQITVNEYLPGQGIASHTDATTCFGPVICILSLASEIAMTFIDRSATTTLNSTNDESFDSSDSPEDPVSSPTSTSGNKRVSVWLPRRSLMVMAGPARYNYSHGIAARRTDKYNGVTIERSRRVSLTFRQVRYF